MNEFINTIKRIFDAVKDNIKKLNIDHENRKRRKDPDWKYFKQKHDQDTRLKISISELIEHKTKSRNHRVHRKGIKRR